MSTPPLRWRDLCSGTQREYQSTDDRFSIVNAKPWRRHGANWKLYRIDARRGFYGSFGTLKDAKACAQATADSDHRAGL
jgi:hypothetical protein